MRLNEMNIGFVTDVICGACGIKLVHDFVDINSDTAPPYYESYYRELEDASKILLTGGCKWALVGFIDTPVCREAYEQLNNKLKLVYQSPVRKNRNSGNNFFFVIYDGQ